MTQEQSTEALRQSIQDWLDAVPGNKLVFGYADAERASSAAAQAADLANTWGEKLVVNQ